MSNLDVLQHSTALDFGNLIVTFLSILIRALDFEYGPTSHDITADKIIILQFLVLNAFSHFI